MKTPYIIVTIKSGTVTEIAVKDNNPKQKYEAVIVDHDGRPDPEVIFCAVPKVAHFSKVIEIAADEFGIELD